MKARTVARRVEEGGGPALCDLGSEFLHGGSARTVCEDNKWDEGKKKNMLVE